MELQNFFSTQFVHQDEGGGGLVVSSNVWIFAAVSVPLTLATLLWWGVWVQIQAGQLRPSKQRLKQHVKILINYAAKVLRKP